MVTFLSVLSILTFFLLIFKFEWGLGFYLFYSFIFPYYVVYFGFFSIGTNLFSLIIIILFFVYSLRYKQKKKNLSLLSPFLFLFLSLGSLILFHFSDEPISYQLNVLRVDLMSILVPFAIINMTIIKNNTTQVLTKALYLSIGLSCIYGVFLLTIPGQNPYIDSIGWLIEYESRDQDFVLEENVRQFGYISSFYTHVTQYGEFLIFSSVFLLYKIQNDGGRIPKILLALVIVNILFCGSRSVLLGEIAVILSLLLLYRKFKTFFWGLVGIVVVIGIVLFILPDYWLFILSITDDTLAQGSSINLRFDQFIGCINSIKDNPLFGNGYGWTGWYRTTIGRHPVMLSFESSLIQILCDNGIVGLALWVSMVVLILKSIKLYFPKNIRVYTYVLLLLISYFFYTFFTGDYGGFRKMLIFYAIIVSNEIYFSSFEHKRNQSFNQI